MHLKNLAQLLSVKGKLFLKGRYWKEQKKLASDCYALAGRYYCKNGLITGLEPNQYFI